MKQRLFTIGVITLIAASALLTAACGSSPKASAAPDELDAAIREASDYLNERLEQGIKIAFLNVQSDSLALSEYIIDGLIENTVNDNIYSVVDRQQLDLIRAEMDFQLSGEVSDDSAQELGRLLGAQIIVSGAVSKIADIYRLRVRALGVQSAQIAGQFSRNIPSGATITALMNSSSQGYDSGVGYSGKAGTQIDLGGGGTTSGATGGGNSGASGGGQAQTGSSASSSAGTAVPAQAQAPAIPTGPLTDGTYTFWPRIQVRQAGVRKNLYLDRILVDGQYFTMFFTGGPTGRAGAGDYHPFWSDLDKISLQNLDGSGRPFNPMNQGQDDDSSDPKSTNGFFITFQGVTGRRFSLTSTYQNPPYVFAEIILREPDAQ